MQVLAKATIWPNPQLRWLGSATEVRPMTVVTSDAVIDAAKTRPHKSNRWCSPRDLGCANSWCSLVCATSFPFSTASPTTSRSSTTSWLLRSLDNSLTSPLVARCGWLFWACLNLKITKTESTKIYIMVLCYVGTALVHVAKPSGLSGNDVPLRWSEV